MRSVAAAFVLFIAFAGGCAPPILFASAGLSAVEEGTSAFIRGELRAARNVPLPTALQAAKDSLEELGFTIKNTGTRGSYAFVIARDADNRPVTVRLLGPTPVITKIKVRIGVFGDGAVSQLLMDRILARMPSSPPAGPPVPPPAAPPADRRTPAPPPSPGDAARMP